MRRVTLRTFVALIAVAGRCAGGPGYRRSAVGMPEGWRRPATSEDSLRSFYDSLRTARDTLLPPGSDTVRAAFTYSPTAGRAAGDSAPAFQWPDPTQDPVLRQLVDTSLHRNRERGAYVAVRRVPRAEPREPGRAPARADGQRSGRPQP